MQMPGESSKDDGTVAHLSGPLVNPDPTGATHWRRDRRIRLHRCAKAIRALADLDRRWILRVAVILPDRTDAADRTSCQTPGFRDSKLLHLDRSRQLQGDVGIFL